MDQFLLLYYRMKPFNALKFFIHPALFKFPLGVVLSAREASRVSGRDVKKRKKKGRVQFNGRGHA